MTSCQFILYIVVGAVCCPISSTVLNCGTQWEWVLIPAPHSMGHMIIMQPCSKNAKERVLFTRIRMSAIYENRGVFLNQTSRSRRTYRKVVVLVIKYSRENIIGQLSAPGQSHTGVTFTLLNQIIHSHMQIGVWIHIIIMLYSCSVFIKHWTVIAYTKWSEWYKCWMHVQINMSLCNVWYWKQCCYT